MCLFGGPLVRCIVSRLERVVTVDPIYEFNRCSLGIRFIWLAVIFAKELAYLGAFVINGAFQFIRIVFAFGI